MRRKGIRKLDANHSLVQSDLVRGRDKRSPVCVRAPVSLVPDESDDWPVAVLALCSDLEKSLFSSPSLVRSHFAINSTVGQLSEVL